MTRGTLFTVRDGAMILAATLALYFQIPSMGLGEALLEFARQAELAAIFSVESVAGHQSSQVTGRMTPEEALRTLLRGSGCEGAILNSYIRIRCSPLDAALS